MSADALFSAENVASFKMQVSRTTRKVRPGASQRPRASLGFDERNHFGLGHRLAAVLAVCSRQRRGELEPDDLAFNDGCRIHDTSVRKEADRHKRGQVSTAVRAALHRTVKRGTRNQGVNDP
jgi:hypothetical protein